MKVSAVFVLFTAFLIAMVSAVPVSEEPQKKEFKLQERSELEPSFEEEPIDDELELGLRFRRVTCDLLSVSVPIGSLNHAACAAHCLAMGRGFRGGRCKDGVCHCRK